MAQRLYQFVIWSYAAAYIFALCIFAVGTWGLLGADRDPLAGVFLIPLGLPWTLLWENGEGPHGPWLALTAPLGNLLLIGAVRRTFAAG